MHIELLSVKWNEFLNLTRKRKVALAGLSDSLATVGGIERGNSEAEKKAGTVGIEAKNGVATPSQHPS